VSGKARYKPDQIATIMQPLIPRGASLNLLEANWRSTAMPLAAKSSRST